MTTWKHRLTGPITKSDFKFRIRVLLIPVIMLTYLSVTMIWNSYKTLDDLAVGQGKIIYKEVIKRQVKGTRYSFVFRLNSMEQFLGIFLGSGESAIEEGKYWDNELQIGDNLKVYYDNNFMTEAENITRLIRKIEKNGKVIYQAGTRGKRIIGFSFLGLDMILIGIGIWVKKRYDKSKT